MNGRALALLLAMGTACSALAPPSAAAGPVSCLPQGSVSMLVRIGNGPARSARLEGGLETSLSLVDGESGQLLWSAGTRSAIQRFSDMDAPFTSSLAAIDLDGDGLHDRIYAGDMAARLWRFDINHGAEAERWLSGGVFADFRNAEGRGFLAPPDISLAQPPGMQPWLNIAIGTAAPGNPAASNRLYVLKDHAAPGAWMGKEGGDWPPLREEDLHRVPATHQAVEVAGAMPIDAPGWFIELGRGHVLTPTLTVSHRAVLVIAEAMPRDGACEVFARIASVDLRQGQPFVTREDQWSLPLPRPVAAGERLRLDMADAAPAATCTLDEEPVPACDVDTRPRRTWWRRTDAE